MVATQTAQNQDLVCMLSDLRKNENLGDRDTYKYSTAGIEHSGQANADTVQKNFEIDYTYHGNNQNPGNF